MEATQATQEKTTPQWLYEFAEPLKKNYLRSIILAILGVLFGMAPYFAVARILILLLGGGASLAACLPWCAVMLVGYLGKTVFLSVSTSVSHKATFHVLKNARDRLTEKLTRLPMGYLLDTPSGKLKDIMVEKVESLETTLAHLLPEMTSNLFVPVCIIIYLFVLDWRMALASLITLPVGFLCYMGMMKDYAVKWKGYMDARNHMEATTVEYINGIEVIKAFGQSAGSYGRYSDAVTNNARTVLKWMKDTQIFAGLGLAIWPSVLAAVLPIGAALAMEGSLPYPVFITVIILSLGIIGPIIGAVSFTDNLNQVNATVGEIAAILTEGELTRPEAERKVEHLDLEVCDVRFAYHEAEVLHGVSLSIPAGSVNALVGPSGGGKSTIARLLAGFWDVSGGSITLGGIDQREIPLAQWNAHVAYVSQDNYLFDTSILENIRMGKAGASDDEVMATAKACGCHEFISQLERGYHTVAGGAGAHLSGGERQRIAIARAMLKNAPIIIFDEATAYTDPENEAMVQAAVAKLIAGKTMLVIAHRLSTITDADNIFLMDGGRLSASGTHTELLEKSPLYADMWRAHVGARDEMDEEEAAV